MSSDPNKSTIETYDQVARQYVERAQRNGDWGLPLEPAFSMFTALLSPGAMVLDIGCGPGKDTRLFRQHGYRAVGLDLSAGMLAEAQHYSTDPFAQADMLHLPFAGGCAEGVWMCASLLHLPRHLTPQALQEAYRVLKTGGVIYVTVKQGQGEGYQTNLGNRFFTYYEVEELTTLVQDAGFSVLEQWASTPHWINVAARK